MYVVPSCHTCACTYVIQLSGIPAFVHPWINGMTEVVQFASVSSMSNVLLWHFTYCTYAYNYVYMHTCTHAQFHTNRLTAGTYYTHLRTHIHTQCHAPSHSKIVYSTLLVISPFPCTMRSWASAVVGGSALVEKVLSALNWFMHQILFALCTRKYSFDASAACSQS